MPNDSGSADGPEPFDFDRALEQGQDLAQRASAMFEVIKITTGALEEIACVRGGAPSIRARAALEQARTVAHERL